MAVMEQVESQSEAEERRRHAEIAKQLASCSKKIRDKAVEILKASLQSTPHVSDDTLRRLWKGLFYCVWHSDKQPVQAHLVRNLASLIPSLEPSLSRRYFQVFLQTIRREWAGIDHLRLDKFYLMITRFLGAVFIFLRDHNWESELVRNYMNDLIEWSLLSKDTYPALGVNLHLVDVFLKELIGFLPLENEAIDLLFEPFFKILAICSQKVLVNRVKTGVFDEILHEGRQYLNLKEVNFSTDNETTHTFCDSGMDDVKNRTEQLGFLALGCGMYNRLFEVAESEGTCQANRKVIYAVAAEFEKLEKQLSAHGTMLDRPQVRTVCASHEPLNGKLEDSTSHKLGNERGDADKDRKKKQKRNRKKSQETNPEEGEERKTKKMKRTKNLEKPASGVHEVHFSNDVTSEINENSKHDALPLEDGTCTSKGNLESPIDNVVEEAGKQKSKRKKSVIKKEKSKPSKKHKGGEDKTSEIDADKILGTLELCKRKSRVKGQFSGASSSSVRANQSSSENAILSMSSLEFTNFNNTVISNLQREFEKVSAELEDEQSEPRTPFMSPPGKRTGKKKKKTHHPCINLLSTSAEKTDTSGAVGTETKNGEKSKKKVRFSMKNNLVWSPRNPLPPESVRVPPSVTPRGSALKKGVPPGPVRPMKASPSPLKRLRMVAFGRKRTKLVKNKASKKQLKKSMTSLS